MTSENIVPTHTERIHMQDTGEVIETSLDADFCQVYPVIRSFTNLGEAMAYHEFQQCST